MFHLSLNKKTNLLDLCSRIWPLLLLRGVVVMVLGGLLIAWPASTAILLIQFMGAYFLVDGAIAIAKAFLGRKYVFGWGWALLIGSLEFLTGIFIFGQPVSGLDLAVNVVVYSVATLAIVAGAIGVIVGILLLRELNDRVASLIGGAIAMIVSGVLAIIIGVVLAMDPGATATIYLVMLGGFALVGGLTQIMSAIQIRKFGKQRVESTTA